MLQFFILFQGKTLPTQLTHVFTIFEKYMTAMSKILNISVSNGDPTYNVTYQVVCLLEHKLSVPNVSSSILH